MEEIRVKAKVYFKHDTEAGWSVSDYIPEAGEKIVYDKDEINTTTRVKYGDGINTVPNLPFQIDPTVPDWARSEVPIGTELQNQINETNVTVSGINSRLTSAENTITNSINPTLTSLSTAQTNLTNTVNSLSSQVSTNKNNITTLQNKHAYAHYVYIDYTSPDGTKKAIFTTLLVTRTAASYESPSTQAGKLNALWADLRTLAGNKAGPHLMASGSFYGEPSTGAAARGYCISNIRNNLTSAGTKQIWIVGYNPDRALAGPAGIALISIDTDTTGEVTLRDFVYQLI